MKKILGADISKTKYIRLFILLMLLFGSSLYGLREWQRRVVSSIQGIDAIGGVDKNFQLTSAPIYLQTDYRWGKDTIGGSGEFMSSVGCTVSSVSMGLAQFGIEMDPGQVNQRLKDIEAYTSEGWLIWHKITELSAGKVEVVLPPNPSHDLIDKALLAGQPVIANVTMNGDFLHWVLIVGKERQEYLVKDPLGSGQLEKLSKFKSPIYAIRILKKRIS